MNTNHQPMIVQYRVALYVCHVNCYRCTYIEPIDSFIACPELRKRVKEIGSDRKPRRRDSEIEERPGISRRTSSGTNGMA